MALLNPQVPQIPQAPVATDAPTTTTPTVATPTTPTIPAFTTGFVPTSGKPIGTTTSSGPQYSPITGYDLSQMPSDILALYNQRKKMQEEMAKTPGLQIDMNPEDITKLQNWMSSEAGRKATIYGTNPLIKPLGPADLPAKTTPSTSINDAITAVKNATAGNNSLVNNNIGGFPTIPKGITMGGGIGGMSNQSADVWDYLKNFQMPNNFEPPNTDAPKVGWGI